MDKYDPHRKQVDQKTPVRDVPLQTPLLPSTASNFYKQFVQFAILVGVVIVPVYTSFDYLNANLRDFVADHIVQYDGSTTSNTRYTISKVFSISVVLFLTFVVFAFLFLTQRRLFLRHKIHSSQLLEQEICRLKHELALKKTAIKLINQRLDQQRLHLRKIQSQMFSDDTGVRHDFVSFRAKYMVSEDGSIDVTKEVILCSPELDVHFWRFYADGETSATPLDDDSAMQMEVRALGDNKTDVIALLIENSPTRKVYSVNFLPVISRGEKRSFLVRYKWPGFLTDLVVHRETQYFWQTSSYTQDCRFDFSAEWHFAKALGNVRCRIPEEHVIGGMAIKQEVTVDGTVWNLVGEQAQLSNRRVALTLWR